jgi:hypothetical protein
VYLAVFRQDGTCGAFTLDVYNASFCADRADAASCQCGNGPACRAGHTCHIDVNGNGGCS